MCVCYNMNTNICVEFVNFFILKNSNIYKNRQHSKELHVPIM